MKSMQLPGKPRVMLVITAPLVLLPNNQLREVFIKWQYELANTAPFAIFVSKYIVSLQSIYMEDKSLLLHAFNCTSETVQLTLYISYVDMKCTIQSKSKMTMVKHVYKYTDVKESELKCLFFVFLICRVTIVEYISIFVDYLWCLFLLLLLCLHFFDVGSVRVVIIDIGALRSGVCCGMVIRPPHEQTKFPSTQLLGCSPPIAVVL